LARLDTGYVFGERRIIRVPVKASETIVANDMVDYDSNGFLQACDAGDIPVGVAVGATTGTVTADGDQIIQIDTSMASVYRFTPDTGTAAVTLRGKTCDVGGAQTIDIDASTDDCILVQDVDTTNNTLLVSLWLKPAGAV
jgi:hypothetical protein